MEVSSGMLLGLITGSIPTTWRYSPFTRCHDAAVDGQPQPCTRSVQTKIVLGVVEPLEG
jgi:hypothetical protein